MIDVSVVIPNYNYSRYLETCLDSIAHQTLSLDRIQVIVIDDASTDDSWSKLASYRQLARLELIREDRNRGYVHAYARGMSMAQGRTLVPLDADDFIADRNALSLQLAQIEQVPALGLVYSASYEVDEAGRRIGLRRPSRADRIFAPQEALPRLLAHNEIQHSGAMIRRDCYQAVNGYDTTLKTLIDWDLWLKLAGRYPIAYLAKPLYGYRIHAGNMHRRVTRTAADREMFFGECRRVIERATSGRAPGLARRAQASLNLMAATAEAADFRYRLAVRDLRLAVSRDKAVLRQGAFYAAVLRLIAARTLGPQGYDRLRRLRHRVRAAQP